LNRWVLRLKVGMAEELMGGLVRYYGFKRNCKSEIILSFY
jgi:hypothetical protein